MTGTTLSEGFPRGPGNDSVLGEFTDAGTIRFVRDFSHPASLVWSAITDAKEIARWFWPCILFEPKQGGRYRFEDEGVSWGGTISVFEPPRRLELDMGVRFELFEKDGHCRLVLTLLRRPTGWSPMTLAGFMGWLGRLTRLIDRAPQEETERFCSDIWEAMWPAYERLIRHHVSGGAKAIYRLHFTPNDAALGLEAKTHLDALIGVLHGNADMKVVMEGFGDDPCTQEESVRLSARRMAAAADYLRSAGIAEKRVISSFALGNYHKLVPSDTDAGRAFNRRIELRPTY
jgi:outer membrane protein OmpA-like peptidoglycan-associated protein